MRRIYLDANGSCPSLAQAQEKLMDTLCLIGNPSSSHDHGRSMRAVIDEARAYIAHALGARDKEVVFTSGASESNRLFVDALIAHVRNLAIKPHVLMSPFEHPSLLKTVFRAEEQGLISLTIFDLTNDGAIKVLPDDIKKADVVILCQAHNETGILPNLDEITYVARPDALIMSDISQAFARLDNPSRRVDVMTFSAQKMGGFAGVGGIVVRGNAKSLPPPWAGGGQERGFRPGTESALLIAAFGEAARHIHHQRLLHQQLAKFRDYFEAQLAEHWNSKVVGKNVPRLPNTSAVCFYENDPDALRIGCDLAGLSVGFGAACSGLAPEGSFALKKLGLNTREEKTCIRFSFTVNCTKTDIDETIERLKMVLSHRSRA